jgi:uncharacterized protein YbjT (DUF2867 family)
VTAATGRLGVVVDTLLARGHSVRAMTRNPDSSAAARLRRIGAEIVPGDFDDPESIEIAASGVDAVFATGTAHKAGPEGELGHGRNLAHAAAAAGVTHLVYSSGDGAAADSPVPLFRVKFAVEEHIRSLPIQATIVAPAYFMENLFNPWNLPALRRGVLPSPIPVDVGLQQLAIADLARFVALAIERPDEFAGRRIPLASDELTASEAASAVSRGVGRELRAEHLPADQLGPGLRVLFGWLEQHGHHIDISALRSEYPDVGWHDYSSWAESVKPRFRGLCPREHAHA